MDTIATTPPLPAIGASIGGGFFAGLILVDGHSFGIVVSPAVEGTMKKVRWNGVYNRVPSAESYYDGLANTRAMAEAGSDVAKLAVGLRSGGFDDWYIPSRDELEICYRAFKPTTDKNYVYRSGENPSAIPPTYPYSEGLPAQTALQLFQKGGSEAFPTEWLWTSTQYAGNSAYAWIQNFDDGHQYDDREDDEYSVRAVRRFAL